MSTLAEVRRLVLPLLSRHPDLVLVGRYLMLRPVRHVLRGVLIDGSSGRGSFVVRRAVMHLFDLYPRFQLNLSTQLASREHGPWNAEKPGASEVLCAIVEQEALPLLRPIDTLDDYVAYCTSGALYWANPSHRPHPFLLLYPSVEAARGNFSAARELFAFLESSAGWGYRRPGYAQLKTELLPLVEREDREGLARLLKSWEANKIAGSKLDKLWQPTPFPFEQGG